MAAGGSLSQEWLVHAYSQGIFPWYEEEQPILWWSPDPRLILFPAQLHVSRSLRKVLRKIQSKSDVQVTLDTAFSEVIAACAELRSDSTGTWITYDMETAYNAFHEAGYAHSVEVWHDEQLIGGLYGVAMGKVFFGESMFSRESDASKIALVYLTRQLQAWDFQLIDCQVSSPHLHTLGATEIPRKEFQELLCRYAPLASRPGPWQFDKDLEIIDED